MAQKNFGKGLIAGVLVLLLAALMVFRAQAAGRAAMLESDAHFHTGELDLSLSACREALRWSFPGAPHVSQARDRLLAIATGAEATGNSALALRAFAALRAGLHETAHPWSDTEQLSTQADEGHLRVLAVRSALDAAATAELARHYERAHAGAPHVFRAAAGIGAVLLLASVIVLLVRERGRSPAMGLLGLVSGLFFWVFAALGA
jgi:hypothetical protein